jgi:hypothetical protein
MFDELLTFADWPEGEGGIAYPSFVVGGKFKETKGMGFAVGGIWKEVKALSMSVGGVWKELK